MAISNQPKVYSWGLNDQFQLGSNKIHGRSIYHSCPLSFSSQNFKPKQIAAGDEHNILLDANNHVYVWGANNRGQLGLGHLKEVDRISKIDFTDGDPVVEVRAKGRHTLAITESGAPYFWPIQTSNGELVIRPVLLHIPNKIPILHGACGYNFTILVAKNGTVFSFGTDNSAGQLGFGDTFPRETPTLIKSIKYDGEKVTQVACGFKHVICKTSLGKLYVWGWGGCGQLGLGNYEDNLLPCQVSLSLSSGFHKSKVLQVHAGYRHSCVLLESKKVYWAGSTGSMKKQNLFVQIDLAEKFPDYKDISDFTPTRILCTWSKSLSVTYATIADTRPIDTPRIMKDKIISTLIQKLEENCALQDVEPPFVESIANNFSAKLMKVASTTKPVVPHVIEPVKKKRSSVHHIEVNLPKTPKLKKKKKKLRKSVDLKQQTMASKVHEIERENAVDPMSYKNMLSNELRKPEVMKKSAYGSIPGGRAGDVRTPGEILATKSSNYFNNQNVDDNYDSNKMLRSESLELDW